MAVKFSAFTQKSDATSTSVTEIVGYLDSGGTKTNVRLNPSYVDTTYSFSTTNGSSPALTLAGTKTGATIADTLVTLTSTGGTTLNGSSTNAIAIDSVTYSLAAGAKAGSLVPINLDASGSFTDSVVNLKEGSNITLTQNSATEIEISCTGGGGGGVSSVGLDVTAFSAFSVAGSPVTSSGNITLGISGGSSGQYLDYQGQWSTPAGGGGGVTSVGLTETGNALSITGTNPITSSGTFNIAGAGTSSQVILGDLTLAALPTDTNTTYDLAVPAATTNINLAGSDGTNDPVTITGGTVLGAVHTSTSEITLNHDSVTRSDTTSSDSPSPGGTVDLVKTITTSTEGHVTAVDVSTVTFPAGGVTKLVVTKTGNNSTSAFTDITTGLTLPVSNSNYYIDVYISGVYQQKSTYAYSTATNGTVTFTTPPPVTATNGIEFVTTT